jgi:hypothetical protein
VERYLKRRSAQLSSFGIVFAVEVVEKPVHQWRKQQAGHEYEYESGVERIQASEELTCVGNWWVDRSHTSEQHGRIQESLAPTPLLVVQITHHPNH